MYSLKKRIQLNRIDLYYNIKNIYPRILNQRDGFETVRSCS